MDIKRIFVTGESGFMGSHIVPMLLKQGHEVYSLFRYISNKKPVSQANIIYGDLKDHVFLNKEIPRINPSVIVHLAAQTSVELSHERPIDFTETNYIGTLNLTHASMTCSNLRMFLWNSTSECYGIQSEFPINESAELRPNSPYAISKAACEFYFKNYLGPGKNFPYFIMCPFNSFGRKNTNQFVVESLVSKMLTSNDITIGNLKPVRDFVYIDDVVDAYDHVINGVDNIVGEKHIYTNTKMNICTGRGVSIEDLLRMISGKLNWAGNVRLNTTYQRITEIPKLIGDHTYATMTWQWNPENTLEEGLDKVIDYWRKRLGK